jgi:hypothetical protein
MPIPSVSVKRGFSFLDPFWGLDSKSGFFVVWLALIRQELGARI